MTHFIPGDFVNVRHFVKLRKDGTEKYLYSHIGIITEVLTGNVQLTINTPDGDAYSRSLDLTREGITNDFFDEITGVYSRLELIR